MRKSILAGLALFLAGCAHTYNMPEAERSRAYQVDAEVVWDAALASVDDIGLALVESEQEHGRIRARAGAMSPLPGFFRSILYLPFPLGLYLRCGKRDEAGGLGPPVDNPNR